MTTRNQRTLDEHYMRTALSLALNGTASVSPNPRVGCVIVRDSAIIGSGWHRCCGEPHAEVEAVRNAGGDVRGATVYVNLEPCCHQGRTPPCAHMLIERGVSRVVVGMTDPNPKVDCMGERMLRDTGIEVTSGILEKESKWINSKALWKGTQTKENWLKQKEARIKQLEAAIRKGV